MTLSGSEVKVIMTDNSSGKFLTGWGIPTHQYLREIHSGMLENLIAIGVGIFTTMYPLSSHTHQFVILIIDFREFSRMLEY